MNKLNVEDIVIFTRNAWRKQFPHHTTAPKTLLYNPPAFLASGICHIAHEYVRLNLDHDPDNQIFTVIESENTSEVIFNNVATSDLDALPNFECIVFISPNNLAILPKLLNKLTPNGLVITIDKCLIVPNDWISLYIEKGTIQHSRAEANITTIEAFIKP